MMLTSLDGVIGPPEQALIPVSDEGLLRGDGVFEVLRLYAGRPFALAEHLERMELSASNIRLEFDVAAVRADVTALLAAAGPSDGVLRLVQTRGGHRLAIVEPAPVVADQVRLGYVTYSPTRVLDNIKSLSYGANMLSSRLAKERGFDEALLRTPHGRILEAPTSSFFWVKDGVVSTPPLEDHVLASITRAVVIELTDAVQAPCTHKDVIAADEAFLASTLREAQPVVAVEEVLLSPGEVTADVRVKLRAYIESRLAEECS
ncbi:MAG: aminotransferase class IV [Solirubrobacterales bacterium]|nr:aminotransferase class IV [Solirubrobacterales bacterium]